MHGKVPQPVGVWGSFESEEQVVKGVWCLRCITSNCLPLIRFAVH